MHTKVGVKIGKHLILDDVTYNMLKRKITDRLLKWKSSDRKKCLLLKGARQTGKTFIVDRFAKDNYKNYLHLNFFDDPDSLKIFDGDLKVDSIVKRLGVAYPEVDLVPGETLIFLDEIQWCPNARTAFKPFTIDGRFDVIGTGSLLGVNYKDVPSYPVGYETSMTMYSLDFEEFLWAVGIKNDTISDIRMCISEKTPIDDFILETIQEHFKWYMLVGGMPEAVNAYVNKGSMSEVLGIQNDIVGLYMDDATKYAPVPDKARVRECFRSIPVQLGKPNKKFQYSDIEGAREPRAKTYGGSIQWLYDAGIVSLCHNLTEPVVPLASNKKLDSFKLYMNDTGLLLSMMDKGIRFSLVNKDYSINKGGITENAVAEQLTKLGVDLTYYERRGTEVDFITNMDGKVTAIEVNSVNNRESKSLNSLVGGPHDIGRAIKLENGNIYVDSKGIIHYPLFVAGFMDSVFDSGTSN